MISPGGRIKTVIQQKVSVTNESFREALWRISSRIDDDDDDDSNYNRNKYSYFAL